MKRVAEFLDAHAWVAPSVLLGGLLVIGIVAGGGYGIAWDEPVQRQYGSDVYNYVVRGNAELFLNRHRYYGPVFEFLFFGLEKALGLEDARSVYLMRHLANFLVLWTGALFFFMLARRILRSWKMGLLASVMLVASPRIFAHGFYNSKDIPFLSMFVVGVYTLVRYLDRRTVVRAVVHGAVCAVLVDTRIVGIMLPALTVAFVAAGLLRGGDSGRRARTAVRRTAAGLSAFIATWAGVTVLCWPTLWRAPLANFVRVFEGMRNFPWEATVLYAGSEVWSTRLPWHYTLVWIGISTPVAYLVLFAAGLAAAVAILGRRTPASGGGSIISRRDLVLILAWLVLPLGYSIAAKAVLYDEWRHSFFVYPALLLVALVGLRFVWRALERVLSGGLLRAARTVIALAIGLNMAATAAFMIGHHPFQNVYFNSLVGGPSGAHGKFEMDYWGLAYRQGLEYIVRHDASETIPVHAATAAGRYNADMLRPADRKRILFVGEAGKARYYITNFRWDRRTFPPEAELYSVRVQGAPIMAVYRP